MARTKRAPRITIRMLRERDACYDDTELAKLFGERRFLTPWDICALKIPAADKLWALLHPTAIPIDELNQLVAVFAAPVLQSTALPSTVHRWGRELLATRQRWLAGETSDAFMTELYARTVDSPVWDAVSFGVRGCALAVASPEDSAARRAAGCARRCADNAVAAATKQLRVVRGVLARVYGPPPE